GVKLNSDSTATATAVSSWTSAAVDLPPTGSFGNIASGTSVKFTNPTWNFFTSSPINDFWSIGGFTFELLSSSITSQGGIPGVSGFVVVSGMGVISANGYAPTDMTWSFTGQDEQFGSKRGSLMFSVEVNTIPPRTVPDGGSTLLLLGQCLLVLALLRKKLAALS
ncbi:MAG TPA: VPDSG-CTERM sorting domain-containing protein, partial [Candidatus Acidoferrales bacterium]|nr:VPDSG-CTERM sorting domain-containing protein [Candidatus Acidoferrales bacterium]